MDPAAQAGGPMNRVPGSLSPVIEALFVVAVLELFMGGGGRLMEIGPGTLRMVLFVPCLLIGLFALFAVRRVTGGQLLAFALILGYLAAHLPGLIVGSLRAEEAGDMLGELQQSAYLLAAPFFALVLQSPRMVRRAATLVQVSGVLLAVAYLGILLGSLLGLIDFFAVYRKLSASGEFVGRGEGLFVYKGFLYLCLAIVFLVALRGRYWKILTLVVSAALVMTLTRGFLLATASAVLLMLFVQGRKGTLVLGMLLALVAGALIFVYFPSTSADGKGSARFETSNNQRIVDSAYVRDHLSARTFVVGEGFGVPINNRANIENTFLWEFWKLGVAGVLFWLSPLVLCTYYARKLPWDGSCPMAGAFYFGVVLVYVQTLTNPFLNNPIGLSFVLVALFSLRTLAREHGLAAAARLSADAPATAPVAAIR